jgi:hypothetical protein
VTILCFLYANRCFFLPACKLEIPASAACLPLVEALMGSLTLPKNLAFDREGLFNCPFALSSFTSSKIYQSNLQCFVPLAKKKLIIKSYKYNSQFTTSFNVLCHLLTLREPQSTIMQYGVHQQTGRQLQHWIETPAIPGDGCPIRPCALKFRNLGAWQPVTLPCKSISWLVQSQDLEPLYHPYRQTAEIPNKFREEAAKAGIRNFSDNEVKKVVASERALGADPTLWHRNYVECCVAPGGIFIDSMFRKSGFYVSEILKAVYEEYFVLGGLRTVMVVDSPEETKLFVRNQLYPAKQLRWPDGGAQRYWVHGTPEFEALLGTKVGRLVSRLVLGAFERGSKRISNIVTWGDAGRVQMRFDIQHVPKRAR